MASIKFAGAALMVAAIAGSSPIQAARDLWMNDAEMQTRFQDATLDGSYVNGRLFVEFYRADGRVEYAERGVTMGGQWSVKAGTLCTIYDVDPTGGCFRVARVGKNCFEFYFASRTEEGAPGSDGESPRWTARGSIRGEIASCPEAADV